MRNATSFATGTASVTAFALLAAALLLAGCDIPGLEDVSRSRAPSSATAPSARRW